MGPRLDGTKEAMGAACSLGPRMHNRLAALTRSRRVHYLAAPGYLEASECRSVADSARNSRTDTLARQAPSGRTTVALIVATAIVAAAMACMAIQDLETRRVEYDPEQIVVYAAGRPQHTFNEVDLRASP